MPGTVGKDGWFSFPNRIGIVTLKRAPTIGSIPQLNYLLAGPDDGCIGKLSPELLHSRIEVFARLLHTIETKTAGELKGA